MGGDAGAQFARAQAQHLALGVAPKPALQVREGTHALASGLDFASDERA